MKTTRQTETFNVLGPTLVGTALLVAAVAHSLQKWDIITHQHIRGTQTTCFAFGEQHMAVGQTMVAVTIMATQAGVQHGSADLHVGFHR
jgi:hypothetical protein